MKTVPALFCALLLSALPAAAAPGDQTIVVTARSVDDTRRTLEACLARKCPPLEDVAASLAHAENLFLSGDYKRARSTVQGSVRRNDRHAGHYPREVASLYRADARISIHLGDGRTYRSSTYGAVRALKKGLDDEDASVLWSRFDVAQMLVRLNQIDAAKLTYRDIGRDAERIGARDIAALADLRTAWLDYSRLKSAASLKAIEEIAASRDPATRQARLAALVLLTRVEKAQGRTGGSERLLKALAEAGVKRPALLWSPPVEVPHAYDGNAAPTYNAQSLMTATNNFEKKWADVGFWIRPDGSVEDAEVLRSSGDASWLRPVLQSIGGRLYSPSADAGGSYRVERYTWTSLVGRPSGSRLRQHSPQGRIEYVDLTAEAG